MCRHSRASDRGGLWTPHVGGAIYRVQPVSYLRTGCTHAIAVQPESGVRTGRVAACLVRTSPGAAPWLPTVPFLRRALARPGRPSKRELREGQGAASAGRHYDACIAVARLTTCTCGDVRVLPA